jgi:hypothetical protein
VEAEQLVVAAGPGVRGAALNDAEKFDAHADLCYKHDYHIHAAGPFRSLEDEAIGDAAAVDDANGAEVHTQIHRAYEAVEVVMADDYKSAVAVASDGGVAAVAVEQDEEINENERSR